MLDHRLTGDQIILHFGHTYFGTRRHMDVPDRLISIANAANGLIRFLTLAAVPTLNIPRLSRSSQDVCALSRPRLGFAFCLST